MANVAKKKSTNHDRFLLEVKNAPLRGALI